MALVRATLRSSSRLLEVVLPQLPLEVDRLPTGHDRSIVELRVGLLPLAVLLVVRCVPLDALLLIVLLVRFLGEDVPPGDLGLELLVPPPLLVRDGRLLCRPETLQGARCEVLIKHACSLSAPQRTEGQGVPPGLVRLGCFGPGAPQRKQVRLSPKSALAQEVQGQPPFVRARASKSLCLLEPMYGPML